MYLEIYLWVDARVKTSGKSLNTIITDAEVVFGVCRRTVWNALKAVKNLDDQ